MSRHRDSRAQEPRRAQIARYRPPVSRGRAVLSAFAMLVSAGIAMVTVVDPYAGATASSYYRAAPRVAALAVQRFPVEGGYVLVDLKRDSYTIVQPAKKIVVRASAGAGSAAGADYTTPVGVAQAYAADLVASRGWGGGQFTCLVELWTQESSWNTHAYNPSGAYGIPQSLPGTKMAAFGADWRNDYRVQIRWGLSYIAARYGSPCGAWDSEVSRGFY